MTIRVFLLSGFLFLGALFPDSAAMAGPTSTVPLRELDERVEDGDDESNPGRDGGDRLGLSIDEALAGHFEEAERLLHLALEEKTDEPLALANLASIYAARGEMETALLALGDALLVESDFRLALANLDAIKATMLASES